MLFFLIWVWVKVKPPGIGPQVLVHVSIYQGKPFWGYHIFDPQPCFVKKCLDHHGRNLECSFPAHPPQELLFHMSKLPLILSNNAVVWTRVLVGVLFSYWLQHIL